MPPVARAIALGMPLVLDRSLRSGLHAVYARGAWAALPPGGAVVAANHHSWWDGYLVHLAGRRLGRTISLVVRSETLRRFPFFRPLGAVADDEPREALRRLARGDLLFVFPEGALQPPAGVRAPRRGAAFLARRAGTPVVPLAIRVVQRGHERPDAFLEFGHPAAATDDDARTGEAWRTAVDTMLNAIDHKVRSVDPEATPPGWSTWLEGRSSADRRGGRFAALWERRS